MWFCKKKTSYSTPFNQKNSKNILRVKKLHGWILIRWVRTWREDGHQVRLVRLVSWDGRLANLQSRGTSRNLRQILKLALWISGFSRAGFVGGHFFMFQWWWCVHAYMYICIYLYMYICIYVYMYVYIYMSMICFYVILQVIVILTYYHPLPTKIAIQFT